MKKISLALLGLALSVAAGASVAAPAALHPAGTHIERAHHHRHFLRGHHHHRFHHGRHHARIHHAH